MKLTLEAPKNDFNHGETISVRLLILNDSYAQIKVDRRLLIGPNLVPAYSVGIPFPVSVEPVLPDPEHNRVILNPWCIYGRQRDFEDLATGVVTAYGYLLRRHVDNINAEGSDEPEALLVSAKPLRFIIHDNH